MKIFKRDAKANDPYEGIECGDQIRDTITGYEGVCIGRIEYISGCNQLLCQPKAGEGKEPQSHWFDVERVELVHKAQVVVKSRRTGGETPPKPRQGPR
ncbi:hypothetical protein [Ascidiaceihabitans sp.]|uniref:hypothetical protein n=1 Tax=Ascidiaceihabitans sp. TaxID=1872644 RepID=UPI00329915C0